jgi:hypothetical protein
MSPALTAALVATLLTLGHASRPPDPTTPSADTTRPTGTLDVAASPRLRTLLEGLTARLTCSEPVSATATLRVGPRTARALGLEGRRGRPVPIAAGHTQCAPGRAAHVTVRPRQDVAERLRRAGRRLKSRFHVALTDAAGNTGRSWRQVIVRP